MNRDAVRDAADELTRCLPIGEQLITEPDTVLAAAIMASIDTGSDPPWNAQAANAVLDAYQEIRDLEHELRAEVTGRPELAYRTRGPARGGSGGNTMAALAAIVALSEAVDDQAAMDAARRMEQRAGAVQQLPAVDEAEPWRRVGGVQCPYCPATMLRIAPRSGRVTCLRYGYCFDSAGRHPVGYAGTSVSSRPMVAWADGLIQYGTAGEVPAP